MLKQQPSPLEPCPSADRSADAAYLEARATAERKVRPAAMALGIVQILVALMPAFQIALFLIWNPDFFSEYPSGFIYEPLVWIVIGGFAFRIGAPIFVVIGAWQMYRLRRYGFSLTAAIVSMLPGSAAAILSMPIGIWAVMVLVDPVVKSAFDAPKSVPARA